jgi:hypothetical protein
MSEQKLVDAKQKVTLYLPADLHRTFKIQAAVECESMSAIAEKALSFYLEHPDLVDGQLGEAHRVHRCPACSNPFVMRQGEPQQLPRTAVLDEAEERSVRLRTDDAPVDGNQPDLVPCL